MQLTTKALMAIISDNTQISVHPESIPSIPRPSLARWFLYHRAITMHKKCRKNTFERLLTIKSLLEDGVFSVNICLQFGSDL